MSPNENPVGDMLVELQAYGEMVELLFELTDEAAAERFFQATQRRKESLLARIDSLTAMILSPRIDTPLTSQGEDDGGY